jgi:aryl-alcohol dehydrogenase-like predicted oxidoreductase
MDTLDRRTFLGAGAGVAATLALSGSLQAAEVPPPPIVPLGDTGIKLSRLALGTGVRGGNRQSNQTRLGFEKFVALMHHAYERGIRFFDMADLYGTHLYFREAFRSLPRQDVAILTKIWWPYDGPRDETDKPYRADAARATLERFCHELNTDYIDIVLLHCLLQADWQDQMQPYMDVLTAAKQAGQVRAVGVSCHDFGAMAAAAEAPWVDVILARINSQQIAMDGTPEKVIEVLKTAQRNKKAVIGMKIFGEGKLVSDKEACIKFAQELGVLDAMTIGFEKPQQIDEVLQLMAKYPAAPVV